MSSPRRIARYIGGLYLITFATSIPGLALKREYLLHEGEQALLFWAVLLEIALAVACVGTAIAFYPLGRRIAPARSLGFVASRVVEACMILVGVLAILSIGALVDSAEGAEGEAPAVALTALHDWSFLVGPGMLPALNAMLFGTILWQAKLVPRFIPAIGFIGAPILLASSMATVGGLIEQVSAIAGAAALPIAVWEFVIGAWLLLRGFNESAPNPT